jgi:hypothetical protein
MPRNGELVSLSEDKRALAVRIRASLLTRVSDTEVWQARVELVGHFTSSIDLEPHDAIAFAAQSGLYVLWPFARAEMDQLARLAGISDAPQLPLIVRPRSTAIEPAGRRDA